MTMNSSSTSRDGAGGIPPIVVPDPMPVGIMVAFAGPNVPSGWLTCDGRAIRRDRFAALFTVIGTTFGAGDGAITFNLPDLRGRFVLGPDSMGGLTAGRVSASGAQSPGGSGGTDLHVLEIDELPAHSHRYTRTNGFSGSGGSGGYAGSSVLVGLGGQEEESSTKGSGHGHDNMPPFLAMNFIMWSGVV